MFHGSQRLLVATVNFKSNEIQRSVHRDCWWLLSISRVTRFSDQNKMCRGSTSI